MSTIARNEREKGRDMTRTCRVLGPFGLAAASILALTTGCVREQPAMDTERAVVAPQRLAAPATPLQRVEVGKPVLQAIRVGRYDHLRQSLRPSPPLTADQSEDTLPNQRDTTQGAHSELTVKAEFSSELAEHLRLRRQQQLLGLKGIN